MSASVFPARAGMSRKNVKKPQAAVGVPRASGDEPNSRMIPVATSQCSPRERG